MNIVVTGGSSGVGEALVNRLSEHEVWILDRNAPESLADQHHHIALDLSDPESIDNVLSELPGTIDGLANVAGIAAAPDAEKVIAVNFLGLRSLTESLIPRLSPGGRIASVSSVAGRDWQPRYEKLMPLLATDSFAEGMEWCRANHNQLARDPYTFSKRLVTAYTLRAAEAAIRNGYRINCVSPGPIETPLYPEFESLMGEEQSKWMQGQTGRAATPNDIAEVVDLLLTGECGWLNGVDIPVDGGYTAGMESGWVDFSQSPIMQNRGG
jgi:NAD(P)-dependent dehydrogenase (short-subunit alcohol dehydrogenase family)